MATRTVRLDEETENVLREVQKATGLPISEALKRGLRALREQVHRESNPTPFDVYSRLDLGLGGYAIAPSTDVKHAVRQVIRRKLNR